MRTNRRYLLIDATNEKIVEEFILDYVGILGWAKAAPCFVKSPDGIILVIERKSLDDFRAAFEIADVDAKILKVSGTLKGLGVRTYPKIK